MDNFLKRSSEPSTSSGSNGIKKKGLYDDNCLKFGFTVIDTKQPNEKNKPVEFFERKLKALEHQKTAVGQMSNLNEKAIDIAEIMFGKQEVEKLKSIPLSDNTIQRRINNLATDVRDQDRKNKGKFFCDCEIS